VRARLSSAEASAERQGPLAWDRGGHTHRYTAHYRIPFHPSPVHSTHARRSMEASRRIGSTATGVSPTPYPGSSVRTPSTSAPQSLPRPEPWRLSRSWTSSHSSNSWRSRFTYWSSPARIPRGRTCSQATSSLARISLWRIRSAFRLSAPVMPPSPTGSSSITLSSICSCAATTRWSSNASQPKASRMTARRAIQHNRTLAIAPPAKAPAMNHGTMSGIIICTVAVDNRVYSVYNVRKADA